MLLDAFRNRGNDPAFRQYIQRSNRICNLAFRAVCCPNPVQTYNPQPSAPPPEPTYSRPQPAQSVSPQSSKSGLIGPEQGCGYSNVTHPRVVGGVPSKLGKIYS